ncbi:GDP-mannose 4,6-dehydratase [Paracoccaceae bacterium]|nr:GDP-mannose 4,6-dehydratase [Paracoccaceae bacterium]
MKKVFITGVNGQDGSYLAELLLSKGYQVHGLMRRSSADNNSRIAKIYKNEQSLVENFYAHSGDLTDSASLTDIIGTIQPDEIYNLAAQSHVGLSFSSAEYTANTDALGTLRILEAIRLSKLTKQTKFYQASTSELYGLVQEIPQKETTPFYPRSPYAVAKLYAYWISLNYREAYDMFTCNGILFNHESPRRGDNFVTRKITKALANIKVGNQKKLILGNLDAKRDWGHAKDFVRAQWLMLQRDTPKDYVISTGEQHTVREFVELAARAIEMNIQWHGSGLDEKGYDASGKCVVEVSADFFRPSEVETLLGDCSLAKKDLGWEPEISFRELVTEMALEDLKLVSNSGVDLDV